MDYKTAYGYDAATGEYTGEVPAFESPLEPGIYHLPANATYDAPPETTEHEAAVWSDKWSIVPDYRGGVYYDKQTQERHEIKDLGAALSDDWTDIEPADPDAVFNDDTQEWLVPFEIQKERKRSEIASDRYTAECQPLSWTKDGHTYLVDAERESRSIIFQSREVLAQMPEGTTIGWKMQGGEYVQVTASDLTAIGLAIATNVQAAFDIEAGLQEQINAAQTEEELTKIHWPTGNN